MAIPETQLDTWSKQGSVAQSSATYETVRTALLKPDSPYAAKSFDVFLQGSYGNDTNIYADSDVDVVIRLDSIYYFDTSELQPDEKVTWEAARSPGSYSFNDFKGAVIAQLEKSFGASVEPGTKAIFIRGNGARRDADVLPAVEYRRVTRFRSSNDQSYHEGICFWTTNGTQIVNYPKQHMANCTAKHQATSYWFKPMVRVLKNMRNSMVERGYLADGVAPSYFLEGMLWNVPVGNFGRSYADTFANTLDWITRSDWSKLLCANELYLLLHPTSPVTWREEHLRSYLEAAVRFWREW